MNICFFTGEKINEGTFKFIISKNIKHKSQYTFKLKVDNETVIDVICYDNVADYMVKQEFKYIVIIGSIETIDEKIYINLRTVNFCRGDFNCQSFDD